MGETLSAEEQALYEAGTRQLDAEEEQTLSGSKANLMQARQRNRELKAEYTCLQLQITVREEYIDVYKF